MAAANRRTRPARLAGRAARALALVLTIAGCVDAPDEPSCRPTQGCPPGACGTFFDGCRDTTCGCDQGRSCAAGVCVDTIALACTGRSCGTITLPDGSTASCGACALEESCTLEGACIASCGGGPACADERRCLDGQLCSAIPGCLAAAEPLLGPAPESVEDRPVVLERDGARSWLWFTTGDPGSTWSLLRAPLVDGAPDFDLAEPLPGIASVAASTDLPPTVVRGEALWYLRIPDEALLEPRFVRVQSAPDGSLQELSDQHGGSLLGRVAPQELPGHALALIGFDARVVRWARRELGTDGAVQLSTDPPFATPLPGLRNVETIRYVQLACDATRLLAWVAEPGVHGRRLLEVELSVVDGAPRLGAAGELTVLSASGDETTLATTPACDTFFQARKTGLTAWRAGACE